MKIRKNIRGETELVPEGVLEKHDLAKRHDDGEILYAGPGKYILDPFK